MADDTIQILIQARDEASATFLRAMEQVHALEAALKELERTETGRIRNLESGRFVARQYYDELGQTYRDTVDQAGAARKQVASIEQQMLRQSQAEQQSHITTQSSRWAGFWSSVGASARSGLSSVGTGFRAIASGVGEAWQTLTSFQSIIAAVAASKFVGWLVESNMEAQRLRVQLTALSGGDVQVGRGLFAALQQLTFKIPETLPDLTEAFVQLRTVGVVPTEKSLTALATVAAAMGGNVNELAHGVQMAVSGQVRVLERVLHSPVHIMGDQIQFTFDGVMYRIHRDGPSIMQFIENVIAPKFPNAFAEKLNTIGGQLTNLKDALFNTAVQAGDAGFAGALQQSIHWLTELIRGTSDSSVAVTQWTVRIIEVGKIAAGMLSMGFHGIEALSVTLLNTAGIIFKFLEALYFGLVGRIGEGVNIVIAGLNKIIEANNRLAGTALGRATGVQSRDLIAPVGFAQTGEDGRRAALADLESYTKRIGQEWAGAAHSVADFARTVSHARAEVERVGNLKPNAPENPLRFLADDTTERGKRIAQLTALAAKEKDHAKTLAEVATIEQSVRADMAKTNLTQEERIRLTRELEALQGIRSMTADNAKQKQQRDTELADLQKRIKVDEDGIKITAQRDAAVNDLQAIEAKLLERLKDHNLTLAKRIELTKELLRVEADLQKALHPRNAFDDMVDRDLRRAMDPTVEIRREARAVGGTLVGTARRGRVIGAGIDTVGMGAAAIRAQKANPALTLGADLAAAMRRARPEIDKANDALETMKTTILDIAGAALTGFTNAVAQAMGAWISGSKSAGQAFKEALFGAIGEVAKKKGDFYAAEAAGDLADLFLGNPGAAAAFAKHMLAASLMYALAGAASSGSAGGSGGGGSAGSERNRANLDQTTKGTATVIWEGEYFDPRDPVQLERFRKMQEEVGDRRMVIKTRRKRVRSG